MKITPLVLIIFSLLLSSNAKSSSFYHSKSNDTMTCDDKKIVTEISDAVARPGTVSDVNFYELAERGKCSPLSTSIELTLIGEESISGPRGVRKVSLVSMVGPDNRLINFYAMSSEIIAGPKTREINIGTEKYSTVFSLTLIFADGYVGGSSHVRDFKDLASCNQYGSQMAQQYLSWGHPASFNCVKTQAPKARSKPETHSIQTLPAG